MQNYFFPNPEFIANTKGQIRTKLLESFKHLVFDVFGSHFTPTATEDQLHALIQGDEGFPDAVIFALHGVLLQAALSEDTSDVPKALDVLKGMTGRKNATPDSFSVLPLADPPLHADDIYLLKRAFADELGLTTALIAPTPEVTEQGKRLVTDALDTLAETAPDWMDELLLLTNQIYFAVADSDGRQLFGGAAVFDAFGAVLINPLGLNDLPTTLMALVHESSHQQMFMYHLDDPIVLNTASDTFKSPLRKEPRPMEGIFHAMWVSARMAMAADAVLKSAKPLGWADELRAQQQIALNAFRDCEGTVAAHAELSEFGAGLFANAQDAINAI